MTNNYKNIVAVLSKESLQDAFAACSTEANVINLLAENGVTVTEAELREVIMQVMKDINTADSNKELSKEQLEQITGGISWSDFWRGFKSCMKDIGEAISGMGVGGVN